MTDNKTRFITRTVQVEVEVADPLFCDQHPITLESVVDGGKTLSLEFIDDSGERRERVYDVAVSDGRTIDADGRCRTPVGDTVDVDDASFLNNIGDAELRGLWTDPDFDPNVPAVYYARVLGIPTPTWQAYDQKFFGMRMQADVPLRHQERAYTSPIWYTP